MGISTDISWADATQNLWIGCTRVGPGCQFCYAATLNNRYRWVPDWGPGIPRHRTSPDTWRHLRSWNRKPERVIASRWPGRKPLVFINSLSDFFDNEVPDEWRHDAWELFRECQNLDMILVTKRAPNIAKMLPENWSIKNFRNIILLITVVNQEEADRDIPKLVALKERYPWLRIGLSVEPMLGPIDLSRWLHVERVTLNGAPHWTEQIKGQSPLDWVIVGGESGGAEARPIKPAWVEQIRAQCDAAGVAFHFKQWGAWKQITSINVTKDHGYWDGDVFHMVKTWGQVHDKLKSHVVMERVGDKAAGRELDGKVYDEFVKAA